MLKLRFKNNKHNAVWLVEPKVRVGRSASNDLVLDDSAVADQHLEILVDHEQLTLVNLVSQQPVQVNGEAVTANRILAVNDVITLGLTELEVVDPKNDVRPVTQQSTMVRAATSPWALKANHASLANRVFPLKDNTVVGRSSECDISLGAAHLSRRHAQLQVIEGLLYVKDLGSANGTYLNGQKVTEARVKRGDELRFDSLSFGVIGPADELDKTTIRAKPAPAPRATATVAKAAAPRPRPAGAGRPAARPAATVQASRTPEVEAKSRLLPVVLIMVLVVVLVGLGGWLL